MFPLEPFSLGNAFKQHFEVVPAFSEELKNEVYRIRHQVYCENLAFEPLRPDGRETDEYDSHSLHLLMRSARTGDFIGCTRIVRSRPDDPLHPFPFEKTCAAALDRATIDPARLPRHSIAEISRLAVVAGYRRRKGEANSAFALADEDYGTLKQPRFPYIPIGLYLGTAELARLHGIDTVFVLTEERLANHFGKLGFALQSIGRPVEHHGRRIPSMLSVSGTLDNMRATLRPLYRAIAADIERGIAGQETNVTGMPQPAAMHSPAASIAYGQIGRYAAKSG